MTGGLASRQLSTSRLAGRKEERCQLPIGCFTISCRFFPCLVFPPWNPPFEASPSIAPRASARYGSLRSARYHQGGKTILLRALPIRPAPGLRRLPAGALGPLTGRGNRPAYRGPSRDPLFRVALRGCLLYRPAGRGATDGVRSGHEEEWKNITAIVPFRLRR